MIQGMPDDQRRRLTQRQQAEVLHSVNGSAERVCWNLDEESDGTQQLLTCFNSWHGMLHSGRTAIIDELDSSLHSRLSRWLLQMVHSSKENHKGGQLIFTTHDTTLLDPTLMRRDQIYITDK